jgi:predicted RNase H-like HicB family nuclease
MARDSTMHRYGLSIFWSNEDQVFIAEVPELPGCAAHGPDYEAVLKNCQDAIALWLRTAREFGRRIPRPKCRRLVVA